MKQLFIPMGIGLLMLASCRETVDTSARYVFTENTVMSYLEKHGDDYSMYVDILHRVPVSTASRTTLAQLLAARGHYTVFAPTDEAIRQYLDTLVERHIIGNPSWEAFTDSTVLDSVRRVIAYNSIIDSGDYEEPLHTYDFPTVQGGEISIPNLYDRKLTFYFDRRDPDAVSIFNRYPINVRNRDITLLNGVIHQMEGVIAPLNITAWNYLHDIVENRREGFLVMARAITACGLKDTLSAIRDEVYEEMYKRGDIPDLDNSEVFQYDSYRIYRAP